MKNRKPTPRDQRPPLPEFTPVPRKCARHDGWTPERQRAFIAALAETGSVTVAARRVNMAHASAYALRYHPEAGPLRRAWDAALDCGVRRLKDEAFDRAMNGQLVPVFSGGKLMGFRRQKNDRLLMYLLRHYGQDADGKRVTLNYFAPDRSSPAVEGGSLDGKAVAAPAAPVPLLVDSAADAVAAFAGVPLDDEAQAEVLAALEACAARQRALAPKDDPAVPFVGVEEAGVFAGELECGAEEDDSMRFTESEVSWQILDDHAQLDAIDDAVARVKAAKESGEWDRAMAKEAADPPKPPQQRSMDWRDYADE